MPFLTELQLRTPSDEFPLNLPVFENFETLRFDAPITFLVGENGSGKSTLLEIIAASLDLPGMTQSSVAAHPLMAVARRATKSFRLVRSGAAPGAGKTASKRRKHGFFFRADDVTGFVQSVQRSAAEHNDIAEGFATDLPPGWGRDRAVAAARSQAQALEHRYGEDPFARSHGELFLELFRTRITAPGLYLMDEPETPLSPTNQLALVMMLQASAARGSQFIVATHAPILMATPGAVILDVDQSPPAPVAWQDVEHVSITKAFLNHPESFLERLRDD